MGNTTEVKEMLEGGADVNQWNSVSRIIILYSNKRGPTMDCLPIPQFCLDFHEI